MNFVSVDLGASSSRYVSNNGKIAILPNNMVFLEPKSVSLITPDAADIESSLEVTIQREDSQASSYFPTTVLMGFMAERSKDENERPSINMHKHVQKINYVSAIVACALSRIKQELPEDIVLYLAVPPIEIHTARETFKQNLVGKYVVDFPKYAGGVRVKLNITDVKCFEESFMASTSFYFNMNGSPKEEAKKFLSGTVLSLDIGASTTDLAIIKGGRYLDKSGQTYKTGGNVARDTLTDEIRERFSMDLPIEIAERTMSEGRLQQGNTFVDVSDLVSIAKTKLAKSLTSSMQTYFRRIDVPIQMINAIVVSGGGSLQSQYVNADGEVVKTSEPMSYFVTQELVSWSSGTEVVPYGDEARYANVKGLFIRAQVDVARAASLASSMSAKNDNIQTATQNTQEEENKPQIQI